MKTWVLALTMMFTAQGKDFRISVDENRPMWNALRIAEQKFGWRVHYEDSSDGSTFQSGRIDITVRTGAKPEEVLQELAGKSPGQFQFKPVGEGFAVFPRQGSILDTRISLPPGEHTITELAKTLTQVTGIVFRAAGDYTTQSFSADNEPAREVLLRLLRPKAAYDLLYTPGSGYVLTVHDVKVTVTLPDARKQHRQSRP